MFRSNLFRIRLDRLHWLLLPLLLLPAIWPLLANGLPARGDRALHLMRLAYLDQSIRQGMIFPRWLPEMMLGRGYPTFNFYGGGVYYLTEFFYLLGLNFFDASIATLILLMLLAGYGMYLLARDLFVYQASLSQQANWASLVAAIAFVYAPYFLTASIYQRGATAEVMAHALMPWVLWSARRLFSGQTPGFWATVLALLLATLVFSHTLMLLIFPPLLAGYLFVLWLQNGRRGQLLRWALVGLVGAIGVSAFFWLPLIVERDYLSKLAYDVVRGAFLPRGMLTWESFVAGEWLYIYEQPPRLGLVQFLLAATGATVAIVARRTWENAYFLCSAILVAALVGSWARPLWESSEILLSIQYPWRMLTLLTLILAIFSGALVAYWPRRQLQMVAAFLLMGVIIYTNLPRMEGMPFYSRTDTEVPPPMLAQLESEEGVETGGEGNTFVQEFRPRWASRNLLFTEPSDLSAPPLSLQPYQGNAYTTALQVSSADGAPLRFNKFYFPGWELRLANGTSLPIYPSTNLGLLTVDLPPGEHQLTLAWRGTPVQHVAGVMSILTLALLAWSSWQQGWRKLALLPLALLALALLATFWRPATAAIQVPVQPLEAHGVRLLGYRLEQRDATRLYIYPYWYVLSGGADGNLQARWQLHDETGVVRSEMVSGPYYNASTPATWPPGTLVEDAYALPLPPGLPAGSYEIVLQLEANGSMSQRANVGTLLLASPVPVQEVAQEVEMVATNALFDDEIRLAGYAATINNQPVTGASMPAVHAGERLFYRLYWQAVKTPSENYHSYIHLLDSAGNAIEQSDQLPGPWFRPPKGWDTYYLQEDTHALGIPATAPGGLYWPAVGLYELQKMERLEVMEDGQPAAEGVHRLPPIKVMGAPAEPPIEHAARFDDGFRLLGYGLALSEGGLYPGSSFEVTLYYRSDGKPSKDYTRFLHLYHAEFGLAAQADSTPQGGINPTWSWMPGETVIDTVTLQVAASATPADYRLFTGFYDAGAGGVRLGVQDETGQPLPDNGVILQTVTVEAQPQ